MTQKVMSNSFWTQMSENQLGGKYGGICNVSKIKLSTSNTATTADGQFILDQKRDNCYPKSNV